MNTDNRPLLLFMGPVAARAGYGEHSRDILKSLFDMDRYNVKVISTPWGGCPLDALNPEIEHHKKILESIITEDLKVQADIFMQCTVPNEFRPIGKFNIGITAGIETTLCSGEWLEGLNRMDSIIVPSEHSRQVFLQTQYEKRNKHNNQMEGVLKCEKQIDVLFEGIDADIYHKTNNISKTVDDELSAVKEKFAFLFVGHWIKGSFGEDRKNISGLIKTFLEAFKNHKVKPALILKTSGATFSIKDRKHIISKIKDIYRKVDGDDLPNTYLIHGDLTPKEMNSLYNHPKVKSFITFTKGEGFGRPMLEFLTTGKPLIATNWSGHVDFINPNESVLLDGELTQIHPSAVWDKVLIKESKWFTVDYEKAKEKMIDVHKRYVHYKKQSSNSIKRVKDFYTLDKMTEELENILDDVIPNIPKEKEMTLPKLEKV